MRWTDYLRHVLVDERSIADLVAEFRSDPDMPECCRVEELTEYLDELCRFEGQVKPLVRAMTGAVWRHYLRYRRAERHKLL